MKTTRVKLRDDILAKTATLRVIADTLGKKHIHVMCIEDFMFVPKDELSNGLNWFDEIATDLLNPLYKWWNQQTLEYWENLIAFGITLPELNELQRLYNLATRPFRAKNRPIIFKKERPKNGKRKSKTGNKSKNNQTGKRSTKRKGSNIKSGGVHQACNSKNK